MRPIANNQRPAIERAARERWGSEMVRAATQADRIANAVPAAVLEPASGDTLAEMLRWAHEERLTVVPRGAGTKLDWGSEPAALDVVLSTKHLTAPIDHRAGDLVATIPAGWSLAEANAVLAGERQWLPLDAPFGDGATIGGIVATNDSGARRQRYGAPRDLIIGIEMTLAEGCSVKAGGRVVKNVAGYDLMRLLCGSFGTLAVVTSATFKLAPLPAASRTLVATIGSVRSLSSLVAAIAAAPLAPSAIEVQGFPLRLIVRLEGTPRSTGDQAAVARTICERGGADVTILDGPAEVAGWRDHEQRIWDSDQLAGSRTIMKVSVLPASVEQMLENAARALEGVEWNVAGRAALGVLYFALSGGTPEQVGAIERLRTTACGLGGTAVALTVARDVRPQIDVWGDAGDALALMRQVKARFDPNRILSPGRGPGGL